MLCDHERWHYEDEFKVASGCGWVGVHLQKHTEYRGGLAMASSKTAAPLQVNTLATFLFSRTGSLVSLRK